MTTLARPTIERALAAAAAATVVLLVPAVYLYGTAPQSGTTLFITLAVAGGLAALLPARNAGLGWRSAWPYAAYGTVLVIVWALRPTEAATAELLRQALLLAVVFATAVAVRRCRPAPSLVALLVACSSLALLQIAGPRSGIDHLGRAGFYHALEQWSGYPEIGLLTAMGGAATAALALAARKMSLRIACGLLTGAFGAATVLLQSRSASLTLAGVVMWLTGVAAVRWRGRVGMVGAFGIVAALAWVLASGPGPAQLLERASSGLSRETQIRKQGWDAAIAMFRDHPVTGVGLGGYRGEYAARALGPDSAHAYNIVLHVAAETGLLGVITYLILWGRVLWLSLRAAGRSLDGIAAFGVHALLAAFFIRSQSEHFLANLETSLRLLLLVAVLFGMAEGLARREPDDAISERPSA